MIPYYAVHNSPVLPSVHLPRSSPDCPLHAAIWAGAQAAFPCLCWSDPQGQVKGCLLYLLPSASILPASSLSLAPFSLHHVGCGSKYTPFCLLDSTSPGKLNVGA